MADYTPRPKPYYLDLASGEDQEQLVETLAKHINASEEMFKILFDDLKQLADLIPSGLTTLNIAALAAYTGAGASAPTSADPDDPEPPMIVPGPQGPVGPTGPAGPAGSGSGGGLAMPIAPDPEEYEQPPTPIDLTNRFPVVVPNGGTGQTTLAAHGVLIGAGQSAVVVSGAGTAGQVLTSNGASVDPSFQAAGSAAATPATKRTAYKIWGAPAFSGSEIPYIVGWDMAAPFNSTTADGSDATTSYISCSGSTTSPIYITYSNKTWVNTQWVSKFVFVVKTGASIAGIRIWVGLFSSNSLPNNSDTLNGDSVAFRYSTGASDPGWVGVTTHSTAQLVTGNVANIVANTQYVLEIDLDGTTAKFSVNGGAQVSGGNYPLATNEFVMLGFSSTDGASKSLLCSRIYGETA